MGNCWMKMEAKTYMVDLRTPLGKRKGILFAERNGHKLNGWLDILKHREPFEGNADGTGNSRISEELVTLMHRIPYVATGQISISAIHLEIRSGRNIFELSGVVCPESEE